MTRAQSVGVVLIILLYAGGGAAATAIPGPGHAAPNDGQRAPNISTVATVNNSSVNVTIGQQLSTVITASSDEVQTAFENTAFEVEYERGDNESAKAEAIADRAEELRDRAEAIREDYEDATEAYQEGGLSKSEYAQRLATLNARAANLLDSFDQLQQRASTVSGLELAAAGLNRTALQSAVEKLDSVSGAGPSALLQRFTGESKGEIELKTSDGLTIEVESEDGEQSREIERQRDDDRTITVNQSVALATARSSLSSPENGSWVLTEATVKQSEGFYEFAFVLRGASDQTGETEIKIDGSSGHVFKLEEEIHLRDEEGEEEGEEEEDEEDDEKDEEKDEHEAGELVMIVADGTPAPNATVTLRVLADGTAAENVTISLNDRVIGTTDTNGRVTVTLPEAGEAELTARKGEAEGELEFEFEEENEEDEVFRKLHVDASYDNGTVSVTVSYNGSGVENAVVNANGEEVGSTEADGTLTFTTTAAEELELEIVKGAFEAELKYTIQNGSLTLTEEAHAGESNEAEEEAEEEESEEEEEDEDEDEDKGEEEEDEGEGEETEEGSDEDEETADDEEEDQEGGDDESGDEDSVECGQTDGEEENCDEDGDGEDGGEEDSEETESDQ